MNFKDLLKEIEQSESFKQFKEQHSDAELIAGFFILDFKDKREESTIDYKSGDKIYTFTISNEGLFSFKEENILDKTRPLNKLNSDIKVDAVNLKAKVEQAFKDNKITGNLEKIIAVLQEMSISGNGDPSRENLVSHTIWNLTCMVEGMKIILIHIDAITGEVIKCEKRSLFDFARPSK